ncbi:MAG: hypothetical protein J1F64_05225 [Oscillospiraceae bacterium]|nr:hypothetical protein [Oscillospiraceae bacterium]
MKKQIFLSFLLSAAILFAALPAFAAGEEEYEEPAVYYSDDWDMGILTDDATDDAALEEEINKIAAETNVGERDESFTDNINIYMNWGTVSPLYSLLNVYTDIDEAKANGRAPTKSFMWFERATTANEKLLPENVTLMNNIDAKYNNGANNAENTKQCMGFVKKVYETYPNAHFTLFTDDLRAQYEFLLMNYNGIPHDRYNVVLGTDGTATYTNIKKYLYSDSNPADVEETLDKVESNWNYYEYWYNEYKRRITEHRVDQARFLNNNGGAAFVMWAEASQDNVEYWLQWPELIVSDVEGLNEIMREKMNLVKKHHNDIYAGLSEDSKREFLNLVLGGAFKGSEYPEDTDFKALYDNTYMPKYAQGGKYMIISGTSKPGEGSTDEFEKRVNAVMEYFGDDYTYLYKPHPAWPAKSVPGREEFLKSKGIVELPAQTPMEVLLWTYPNVKVGGYNSSLYMSATTQGQVRFFFTDKFGSLIDPLPDLCRLGMYLDAVLFNPEPDEALREQVDMLAENIDVGEKDEKYTGDINIYTTYGTLPTLYALLNVYKDIDDAKAENREPAKSYMWFLRGSTANAEKLPDNVTIMAELSPAQIYNSGYAKRFMAYAEKLYQTYPNAHFNLFCDDLRAQSEITFFTFNGIPESSYNVYLLSDGTGSYSFIKNYFYKDSEPDVDPVETAEGKWGLYEYWYNEYKRRAKAGNIDTGRFLANNMGACYIMYAASSKDNIQYYLQWPELMISDDPSVNDYLEKKMHRTKTFPSEIYSGLTPESQDDFLEAVLSASGLTRSEYDNKYLSGIKDGKKYMIISGTAPGSEGNIKFESRVENMMAYFGDEYTYLYKPHPSWPASSVAGREAYLASKGIVELPAQTPMEVILTAYPEVDLGGYNSSLYMSATGEHVKFFFTDKFSNLSAPLPDLYKLGMYPYAVLFNPGLITSEQPKAGLSVKDGVVSADNPELVPDGVIIAAVYGEGEELVDIKTAFIKDGDNSIDISGLYEKGRVKCMLWESLSGMIPATDFVFAEK